MSLVDYDRCRGVKVNCKKRRASSFLTPHSSWLSHQIILEQCVSGWLLSWGTEQLLAAMPLLCINKTSVQFVQRLRYRVVNWKTFLVKTCGCIFEFDQWVLTLVYLIIGQIIAPNPPTIIKIKIDSKSQRSRCSVTATYNVLCRIWWPSRCIWKTCGSSSQDKPFI